MVCLIVMKKDFMNDAMFQDRRIYLNSKGLLNKQTEINFN